MPTRKKNDKTPLTTAQSLSSLLKSARDTMRKDKGLNGDLDRLPLLTWVMFLKFLDDLERQGQEEAVLASTRFRPAVEAPYRWRDWAAVKNGLTGDDLLAFVNNETTALPDGSKGPGLFHYLRKLTASNGDKRRDVIATVFRGVDNRMKSGYLLRDVIDKIDSIHFTSSDELHTLGALYENLLREMRDAAGDAGEFYTPRTVVRLMVKLLDPRLGETVLDPACGTGGFLVEAYSHLYEQVRTVPHGQQLQRRTLYGCEPKSLPYLLCQMNLLLHGLDAPDIDPGNALRNKLADLGDKDRVHVILTNPPFGGEEEKGIQGNFPDDKQTSETALLFLQLIMRRLHRRESPAGRPARAAVVVPNGTLFGDGVCARIKAELLRDFNLHTVLRLPNGVFAPYTSIPTNVLFFDRGGPTADVWYWEHRLPEGRKNYTKTQPLQFDEFAPLMAWWQKREEGDQAWKVPAADLLAANCNLDRKNPRAADDITHRAPEELVASVLRTETQIDARLRLLVSGLGDSLVKWPVAPLEQIAEIRSGVTLGRSLRGPTTALPYLRVANVQDGRLNLTSIKTVEVLSTEAAKWLLKPGDLLMTEGGDWDKLGRCALWSGEIENCIHQNHVFCVRPNRQELMPEYLAAYARSPVGKAYFRSCAKQTTNLASINQRQLRAFPVVVPPLNVQAEFVANLTAAREHIEAVQALQSDARRRTDVLLDSILSRAFSDAR